MLSAGPKDRCRGLILSGPLMQSLVLGSILPKILPNRRLQLTHLLFLTDFLILCADSSALIEFDAAAKALVRGGALSSRSANLVPAALQHQISGQIAAAAVYANQSLPQISDDVQPLGPIFPRIADVDSVDISSVDIDDNAQARGTETKSENPSGKKKKKRKSGSARQG